MLVQHTEEFSSLVVDEVEDIFVNMDKNSTIIIDEHQLNEIRDLDGVISLQIVRLTIPIDEKDVRRNLGHRREDVRRNNRKVRFFSFSFVSKCRGK